MLGLALTFIAIPPEQVIASSGDATVDPTCVPNCRGSRLLEGRESILLEQVQRARRTARARGLALYRWLRFAAVERRAEPVDAGARLGGRSVSLVTAVLERDLGEARELGAELDRVRAERAALAVLASEKLTPSDTPRPAGGEAGAGPLPAFARPVPGALVAPFGMSRDPGTGAWSFRAGARFAARPAEVVRSPADGRVARVARDGAGVATIVLAHAHDWTTVLGGLRTVVVAPGDVVRRGGPLGRAGSAAGDPVTQAPQVTIETWRGRAPVDPESVLRVPLSAR